MSVGADADGETAVDDRVPHVAAAARIDADAAGARALDARTVDDPEYCTGAPRQQDALAARIARDRILDRHFQRTARGNVHAAARVADDARFDVERAGVLREYAVRIAVRSVDRQSAQCHVEVANRDEHAVLEAGRRDGNAGVDARRRDDRNRLADAHRPVTRRIQNDTHATVIGLRDRNGEAATRSSETAGVSIVTVRRDECPRRGCVHELRQHCSENERDDSTHPHDDLHMIGFALAATAITQPAARYYARGDVGRSAEYSCRRSPEALDKITRSRNTRARIRNSPAPRQRLCAAFDLRATSQTDEVRRTTGCLGKVAVCCAQPLTLWHYREAKMLRRAYAL